MPLLYSAADIFVSAATSILETYGKSPLESIQCGVPVVLPNWDGFPSYINSGNSLLAKVNYRDSTPRDPFSFTEIDVDDFAQNCLKLLRNQPATAPIVPLWAGYDHTMEELRSLVRAKLVLPRSFTLHQSLTPLQRRSYPPCVQAFLDRYQLRTAQDLLELTEPLISQCDPVEPAVLKSLHDTLFQSMTSSEKT